MDVTKEGIEQQFYLEIGHKRGGRDPDDQFPEGFGQTIKENLKKGNSFSTTRLVSKLTQANLIWRKPP